MPIKKNKINSNGQNFIKFKKISLIMIVYYELQNKTCKGFVKPKRHLGWECRWIGAYMYVWARVNLKGRITSGQLIRK